GGEPAQPEPARLAARPQHSRGGLVEFGPDPGSETVAGLAVHQEHGGRVPGQRRGRERVNVHQSGIRHGTIFAAAARARRGTLTAWVSTGTRSFPGPSIWLCGAANSPGSGPGSPPAWTARYWRSVSAPG